jgi:hypothetical protein
MPRYVAMERPYGWVILRPLQDNKRGPSCARRTDHLHVSPLGVVRVLDGAVPVAEPFRKDMEVVSVELQRSAMSYGPFIQAYMKGVRPEPELVFYNEADGAVSSKVVDVIFCRERQISSFGVEQNRVVVIAPE